MQDDIMTLRVVRRDIHTNEIAVIDLAAESGADLPAFEAGAHIDIHLDDGLVRQYSLSNPQGSAIGIGSGCCSTPLRGEAPGRYTNAYTKAFR